MPLSWPWKWRNRLPTLCSCQWKSRIAYITGNYYVVQCANLERLQRVEINGRQAKSKQCRFLVYYSIIPSQRVKRILATGIHNRSRCAVPGFGSTWIPSFLQLPWIRTENLIWLKHDGWSCRCFLRDGRLWNHRLLVGAKVLVSPRPKGMRWNINPAIMCSTAARLKVINNAVLRTPYRKLKEDTPDHLIAPVVPVPVPRIIFDWAISRRDETFLCLDHG